MKKLLCILLTLMMLAGCAAGAPGTAFPTGFVSTHAAPTRRGDS